MEKKYYVFFAEGLPIELSEGAQHYGRHIVELPLPMSSEAEQKLMQTIENPDLLSTNDVRVYRDHIRQKGLCFDQPDLPKCSARAAKHRSDGNLLYAKKEYGEAMKKYTKSICCAPNDSEDLGIGYANRSAIYYDYGDYILALANIELAKKHNYPERLMSKLMAREANCKEAIDKDKPNEHVLMMPSGLDLSPFLSDGICVRKLPLYNNSLVARKDFEAGELILQERPLMAAVEEPRIFNKCNHCKSDHLVHLLPCPNCTSAVFCNEKCLQDGQTVHRFECGITGELSKLNNGCLGSRMFFHGLALFDDDIDKMMAFCRTAKATKNTFLDMDYGNYDPMKEFEIFLAVKPEANEVLDRSIRLHAAIVHAMLWNVPSVRALITNREQEDFMLQCFAEYMQKAVAMSIQRSPQLGIVSVLYPMASLCNHSCDPNTIALNYGGQLKLTALRPIRRGEQVFIMYGSYHKQAGPERRLELAALGFKCICDVCDEQKHQERLAEARRGIRTPITPEDAITIGRLMNDTGNNFTGKKKALQQFVQRYASNHPCVAFAVILKLYAYLLIMANTLKMNAIMRAMIAG